MELMRHITNKFYRSYQRHFLKTIKEYAETGDEQLANQRGKISLAASDAISENVKNKLNCHKSDIVVEIGCGTGLVAKAISSTLLCYAGFDLSIDLLQLANKHNSTKNTHFLQGDGQRLPIKNSIANKVLINNAIPYFPNSVLRKVVQESQRILKPGGLLMLGDIPNPHWARYYLRERLGLPKIIGLEQIRLIAFHIKIKIKKFLGPGGMKLLNKCYIWYKPKKILKLLEEEGFKGEILKEDINCPFSHFRYDCLARKLG